MTKFSNPKKMQPTLIRKLNRVISSVNDAVNKCCFIPRIASEEGHHNCLWDNVEFLLLGCSRGIAIVEDKCKKGLNPNVALEWGWMKGMGKSFIFLKENSFKHGRDWSGLLNKPFNLNNPETDILDAITEWLSPKPV